MKVLFLSVVALALTTMFVFPPAEQRLAASQPTVECSSNGGDTWASVSGAGEFTGYVYLQADSSGGDHVGVTSGSDSESEGAETIYRVDRADVDEDVLSIFDDRFDAGQQITMSWDANGAFTGVE